MDLYKIFLFFYRTKPIKVGKIYEIDYNTQGLPGNIGMSGPKGIFTYDLVSDPGFIDTDYSNYISEKLKDTKNYSDYINEEMNKLPNNIKSPELLNIISNIINL